MSSALKFFSRGNDGPDWAGFLDRDTRVEGTLEAPGTFRLDGALKGKILSSHTLVLGETAEVRGEIEGNRVLIFGRFRGTLRATELVEIHKGAVAFGDFYTPCLVLEPGGRFDGHCYLNPAGAHEDAVLVPIRTNAQGEPPQEEPPQEEPPQEEPPEEEPSQGELPED